MMEPRGLLPMLAVVSAVIHLRVHCLPAPKDVEFSDTPHCPEVLPPPDQPFRVVWNHPDPCERMGIHMNFSDYGIIFNKGRQFIGNEIQTLYKTGEWPHINRDKEPINGGLPQLFNSNFAQTRADLDRYKIINFTGLAVLDFQSWRPNFNTNFGSLTKYRTRSKNLVKQRHPQYNTSMVKKVATEEWESAARRILMTKLAIGQEIMPHGHWGYYNYPRAWFGNSSASQNNRQSWLWRKATGLYPRIYITDLKTAWVVKQVTEAIRIQNTFSPPNTVIYPYSKIQKGAYLFFNTDHLKVTLGLPADMGVSGIVLWGSSGYYRVHGQCKRLQQHVRNVLGPYVKNLTQFMSDCSGALCGGHGRCVHNSHDTLINESESKALSAECTTRESRFHDYHCRCYHSWSGACCTTYEPSPCQTTGPCD